MIRIDVAESLLTMKGHVQQAKAVETGDDHAQQHRKVTVILHPATMFGGDFCRIDNRVLGIEAGEERHPDQRQRADPHRDPGDRHVLAQTAHAAHVLLVMQGDDHRTGAEEQQRLEEGVRHQVEDCRRIRRYAERDRHVAQLR